MGTENWFSARRLQP